MNEIDPATSTSQEITTTEKGSALEMNIQHIFRVAGFDSKRNVRLMKYEIDVLVEIGDRKIVIECKNYQGGGLAIRNLIHEWSGKNEILKADKLILALAGVRVNQDELKLASARNIEIWTEQDFEEMFSLTLRPEVLRERLLKKIDFRPIQISDVYGWKIAMMNIASRLCGYYIEKEYLFTKLNEWLRIFIRTNLQLNGTTHEDRLKHIQLFEGAKEVETKHFFNLIKSRKVRSEVEYWEKVKTDLEELKILTPEIQEKYLRYMDELIEENRKWQDFFEGGNEKAKLETIIYYRLYHSTAKDERCEFQSRESDESVVIYVYSEADGQYRIVFNDIDKKSANMICWILTSEYSFSADYETKTINYSWSCSSIEEATEKICRLCTEFLGITSNALKDRNLPTYKIV